MSPLPESGRSRAVERAVLLKRASVVAAAMRGIMPTSAAEITVPPYHSLPRRRLDTEVRLLTSYFGALLDFFVGKARTKIIEERAAIFLSKHYEAVVDPSAPFSMCTVQEFVARVARLPEAELLDAPPYTEMLIQGFRGMAYRHPEYMLARDVEFLYDAFWQAEDLIRSTMRVYEQPRWMSHAVENVQSLARATILSCFSLLESTVSGLGRAHVMTNASLPASIQKQLLNPHGPLLDRLLLVPKLITGHRIPLDPSVDPLATLFSEIKQRRDAFMHCEPGDHVSRPGFKKQERFHDVSAEVVDTSVGLTVTVVQSLWHHVHAVDTGPFWLRQLGKRSEYRRGLRLVPVEDRE